MAQAAAAETEADGAALTDEPPRKLTLKVAAEQWARTTRAIEGLRLLQADAGKFLLDNAEKTGKTHFGDEIAVVKTGGSTVFDQAKAKDRLLELGEDLAKFMKKSKFGRSLKLLK